MGRSAGANTGGKVPYLFLFDKKTAKNFVGSRKSSTFASAKRDTDVLMR